MLLFNVCGLLGGGATRGCLGTRGEVRRRHSLWPAANMINFMYCPPGYALFLNSGLYWNAFLSFQNVKANAAAAAAAEGAEGDVGDAVNAVRSIDVGGG